MSTEISTETYERLLVDYIANTAIGISALRNQYPKEDKAVDKCREYVKERIQPIDFFQALEGDAFEKYLDQHTAAIKAKTKLKFGSARKVLNIFLRNLAYNANLQRQYLKNHTDFISNHSVLNKLEVPVDSYVAKGLLVAMKLPKNRWNGVKNLKDPKEHQDYQEYASIIATDRGVARPHLDLEFYNQAKRKKY